jgi:hypothetical protein
MQRSSLEVLLDPQLLEKFNAFHGTCKFICVHKTMHHIQTGMEPEERRARSPITVNHNMIGDLLVKAVFIQI